MSSVAWPWCLVFLRIKGFQMRSSLAVPLCLLPLSALTAFGSDAHGSTVESGVEACTVYQNATTEFGPAAALSAGYCMGIVQGIADMLALTCDQKHTVLPSMSEGAADQMVQAFLDWAAQNPDYGQYPLTLGVALALGETDPCPRFRVYPQR